MKSFYEKLLKQDFDENLLESKFKKVDTVKQVGEFSFSKKTTSLNTYSYDNIYIEMMFDSKKSAYKFIFDKFTEREINFIDSIINFFLNIYPIKYEFNPTERIKIYISGFIFIKFSNFELSIDPRKENYNISFISDNMVYKHLENISFESLYNYFISKVKDLLKDINGGNDRPCNYDKLIKILKIDSSRELIKFKSINLINYITDVEYAINLRKFENIKIFDNCQDAKFPKQNEIHAVGNIRLKKNISHIAKHKKTVIIINRESLYLLYEILEPMFKYEQIIYIEKIILTMLKYFKAYNKKEYNELIITRKNIDKNEIQNILSINSLFEFDCWPFKIEVGGYIKIWANGLNMEYNDFKSAYNDINEILIKKIANDLNIEPSDVNEDSYKLISMMSY